MRYLLDTNICIHIAKRKPERVRSRLERLRPGDAGMSVITYAELVYGARNSERMESNLAQLEQLRGLIPVMPLAAEMADPYGRVRTVLRKKGLPIGAYDLLIAAQALQLGLILVTNNTREFARIPGLEVENWTK
jgi:tRNA(fMet)-specific endonuclease VapC